MTLVGYDLDGTLIGYGGAPWGPCTEADLTGCVVISGRTFAEYDDLCRSLAQRVPLYIRGTGVYGDHAHAARFKAQMINLLGVTTYYEDRADQAAYIRRWCPSCQVILVGL